MTTKMFNCDTDDIVKNAKVTSEYGIKRNIKCTNGQTIQDVHNGIDIVSKTNELSLFSIADGKVLYLTNNDGTGARTIVTAHGGVLPNDYVLLVLYSHLASFTSYKNGDKLVKGCIVGTMGKTGNASGVHLHCSVYAIPPDVWHTDKDTWYKWDYKTRERYQINPQWILGL